MGDPLPRTIPHAAERAARLWPNAPAVIEDGETLSFAQLWQECRRAASALLDRGVSAGDRVAIWAPNSREWVVAAIAAQACGAAVVPLNTRLKGREAGDILRRSRACLLFTVRAFLGIDYQALIVDEDLPDLRATIMLDDGFAEVVGQGRDDDPRIDRILASLDADTLSDIMFTSGTTGAPKGVMSTHGRVVPLCAAWIANTGLTRGERYLLVNPFFHSFGYKVGWLACLVSGAVIVPMPQFDVKGAMELIERERIAFLPGPPTIFQMLLAEHDKEPFDCSSLRGGTTGAAMVPPQLIERIRAELGIRDIITAYGMTECLAITSCRPGDAAELIASTCGVAMPGHEVIVADDEGRELPRGETGEIFVRGPGVMLGYLDDAEATAKTIDGEGWLHTGDVGTMDKQGYLRITDRKKDMYISGGFNCYPAEIEKLLSAHPAVGMVAVVGVPDQRLGEVGRAFVVPRPGIDISEEALMCWSRENMANYKVPRSFRIVDELPRNASGKIMKSALADC
ncbi:3-[(3aS,4S,7aS)-7a-methyl-1,5-dioxo-octahydro-1H-inden-4-yl]propanoyl:CoA ligase [Novosphingobium endophyticum]|uniref:3-[(3aS,4S,7aS)-7a-methyl-1, 5-dioxo-octahydro-1H-inden-4-yl]propanoyl:CoA ligase n=1 Tax=Novosphingobium endophyticum TaxID=1955250 RepID=A0A916TU32_9SPHN|nr:FadD3 family acyl-CoA ligase [Novosphingobium endophyticum]GGC07075.1 3-[(3aS,4S,7aS)-7a-methyl-1,5-dioxo-octahydro-1H-inden-4-yl]propanoyl:CoA ligase [Novosphingobium endophyticum]